MGIVTTEYAEKLMKRCQIGTRNYNEANDLHAECYGTIGALVQERDTLQKLLNEAAADPKMREMMRTELRSFEIQLGIRSNVQIFFYLVF